MHRKINIYRNIKLQNLRINFFNKLLAKLKNNNGTNKNNNNIYHVDENSMKIYEQIITKASKISKENDYNLNIVYLPSYARYTGTDYSSLLENVKKLCENLDVNFINLHEQVFLKQKNPLELFPFQINSHYTEDAYQDISNVLTKYIKE